MTAPRLARPAALAALVAGALAVLPAPAIAMTKQDCLKARYDSAMSNLATAGEQGSVADYWSWFQKATYALGYLKFCAEDPMR